MAKFLVEYAKMIKKGMINLPLANLMIQEIRDYRYELNVKIGTLEFDLNR